LVQYYNQKRPPLNFLPLELWYFIAGHVLLWTVLPVMFHHNIPLDTVESVFWGKEWQWGYYKHPPMVPWVAEMVAVIFNRSVWAFYFLSQLCIATTFIAVWRLAKLILQPTQAILSVMMLEGVYYYNFTSPEYNHNVLLMPLWAWTIYFAWRALSSGKLRNWLALGFFSGVSILTKYYALILLASIILMALYVKAFRRYFITIKPYAAMVVCLIIIAPHISWLISHDFISITYASSRSAAEPDILNHIKFPMLFAGAQLLSVMAALILFFSIKKSLHRLQSENHDVALTQFLVFTGLGPFFLTVIFSGFTGAYLKDMWGMPLWSLTGIMLFYFFPFAINAESQRRFCYGLVIITSIAAIAYIASLTLAFRKRAHFNGQFIASEIESEWKKHSSKPVPVVVGNTWLAGNIAFYMNSRPTVFLDMDSIKSPWISEINLQQQGGIAVWNISEKGEGVPEEFLRNNIVWQLQTPVSALWINNQSRAPYRLGWAIVSGINHD